jgi:hypothetical protein
MGTLPFALKSSELPASPATSPAERLVQDLDGLVAHVHPCARLASAHARENLTYDEQVERFEAATH